MDRPRSPRKVRWLRRLRRSMIFLACLFVGIPTLEAVVLSFRVLWAVGSAQSVRLEAFDFEGNVVAAELDRSERKDIALAMPPLPDVGVPGLTALCFVPHHRIVTRASSGQEKEFLVCFECEQLGFFGSLVSSTPFLWRSSIRRLFTNHGIPVQEPGERFTLSLGRGELGASA
jgi:hypothetical protein